MSELPKGWLETTLGEVVDYGTTLKAEPDEISGDEWVLELEDIEKGNSRIVGRFSFADRKSKSTKNRFSKGDVLYGKLRPYLNKVVLADSDGLCTTEIVPIKQTTAVENRYVFHWLKGPRFLNYAASISHGLNMPRLGTDAGRKAPFILAPLAEQKRIADKLDSVLMRVDACRERLERVPVLIDRFRRSVLVAATTGRLTESWREGKSSCFDSTKVFSLPQGYKRLAKQSFKVTDIDYPAIELPGGWTISTIADLYNRNVIVDFADGNHGSLYPRKEDFDGKGALFLTASQIDDRWGIAIEACPRLSREKSKLLNKGWTKQGDVLLTHNATVGRVAILEGTTEDVLLGTSVTFYRLNSDAYCPEFLRIVFASPFFQEQLTSVMAQTTRDQVPITKQVSLHVVCPPIDEQREIAQRVESLLVLSNRLESRLAVTRDAMGRLVPALLAKAFRGELVPQDPYDEPAEKLLEGLKARTTSLGTKGKRSKRSSTAAAEI
ncbi:restriction endonuclease subunit S [Paraburkholderia sp. PREW-6R]|uniref:restriction endonuclease subunit S n=1 Tax=Paraburkholderia sp. PREW-6R TaxID=3141544 RepID=UPI0031F520DA